MHGVPISSAHKPVTRLIGQELNRLKVDELVSGFRRNSEDTCKTAAWPAIDSASQQTEMLPVLARRVDPASLSHDRDRCTPSRIRDGNLSVQLSERQDEKSEMPPSPEGESLRPLASSGAYVRVRQERSLEDAFVSLRRAVNGDWQPERGFHEDRKQIQHVSPGAAIQQPWRSSTHFPVGGHASRLIDLAIEDTWHLPVVGGKTARWSLITSVLRWLKGK